MVAILVRVHWTKPTFGLGQNIDESNPYMKFGRNQVINDLITVSSKEDGWTDGQKDGWTSLKL